MARFPGKWRLGSGSPPPEAALCSCHTFQTLPSPTPFSFSRSRPHHVIEAHSPPFPSRPAPPPHVRRLHPALNSRLHAARLNRPQLRLHRSSVAGTLSRNQRHSPARARAPVSPTRRHGPRCRLRMQRPLHSSPPLVKKMPDISRTVTATSSTHLGQRP